MTVALYARRKNWPVQDVKVRVRYFRIHAVDCAECETKEGYLERIDWRIEFKGDLTAGNADIRSNECRRVVHAVTGQRARLLEIAGFRWFP